MRNGYQKVSEAARQKEEGKSMLEDRKMETEETGLLEEIDHSKNPKGWTRSSTFTSCVIVSLILTLI